MKVVINRSSNPRRRPPQLAIGLLIAMASSLALARQPTPLPQIKKLDSTLLTPTREFCQRLDRTIASSLGTGRVGNAVVTNYASQIISGLRDNKNLEFIPVKESEKYQIFANKSQRYLSLAEVLQLTMNQPSHPRIIFSPEDLRYLPYGQHGIEVILITSTLDPLDLKRANLVLATAKRLSIRISLIWVGRSQLQNIGKLEQSMIHRLITGSAGALVDLGGPDNPCVANI